MYEILKQQKSKQNKSIDIIVPIYNAYDDVVLCLNSLYNFTDLNRNRLILINDHSTDPRIKEYLDKQARENIIVIHNEANKGFSNNINLGIAQSETHDVLLLNSDTIVTRKWLEKIEACAYSDPAIATVTPLSNNASLCSVPVFCRENEVPEGYTIDSYAELIEKVSLRSYPTIPVANGFCMYIKREVISKIGSFDAETFGRGYGEENDFCHRAEQIGYRHAMCDDVYIYHSGTESFQSEEKKRYIEEHSAIINSRYPQQARATDIHCRDNPNHAVFDNINIHAGLENESKNILYVVQRDFRKGASDNVGGTQLHVKDLTMGLKGTYNIFVAARDSSYLNLTAYIGEKEYFFRFYIGNCRNYMWFHDRRMGEIFGKILDCFQIDLVHIHHVYTLSCEVFYQADMRKIPIFATLHDLYYICPTVKLLDTEGKYCGGMGYDCKNCLKKRLGIAYETPLIQIWRKECENVLRMAEKLFLPSESAKQIYLSIYPDLADKMNVIAHGSNITEKPRLNHRESTFNIAFIGGISEEKGSGISGQLIRMNIRGVKWHLFGVFDHADRSVLKNKNFIMTGSYTREELPGLMEKYQIDLVCILPIIPETFCYTLSEAVACGVPVVVTEIGALKERVSNMECGWTVPTSASAVDIMSLIERIKDRGVEYQEKLAAVQQVKLRTAAEMCECYQSYYKEKRKMKRSASKDYVWMLNAFLIAQNAGNYGGDESVLLRLAEAEKELEDIRNSTTYRAMGILAGMKIPFRKQIKQILAMVYGKIK